MSWFLTSYRNILYSLLTIAGIMASLATYFFMLPVQSNNDNYVSSSKSFQYEKDITLAKKTQGFYVIVSTLMPWGQQNSFTPKQTTASNTQKKVEQNLLNEKKIFRGIIHKENDSYLIFLNPNDNTLSYYRPQQNLPDGNRLLEINADHFIMQTSSSKDDIVKLYSF